MSYSDKFDSWSDAQRQVRYAWRMSRRRFYLETVGMIVGAILFILIAVFLEGCNQSDATSPTPTITPKPTPNVLLWYPAKPGAHPIAGYKLRIGVRSGIYARNVDVGPTTWFPYSKLKLDSKKHSFVVVAYDTNHVESPPSNEIHWP